MRFKLVQAITISIVTKKGKTGTPVIAYLLEDVIENQMEVYNRKEAYELINQYGGVNVNAYTRMPSSEEDLPDEFGLIYYLKPNNNTKIRDYLISVDELEPEQRQKVNKLIN